MQPAPPHIIFHLVDDWGWDVWPGHGAGAASQASSRALLPAIGDLFVANGMQLRRHYTTRMCAPTRRALLAGRTVAQVGLHNTDCPGVPLRLELLPGLHTRPGPAPAPIYAPQWQTPFILEI